MNGGHDLGGKHGLGPIDPEAEALEPVFHSDWERRVFALTLATGMLGKWNIDESRFAREQQHPADYLRHSYYENWLEGLERLLQEKGLLESEVTSTSGFSQRVPNVAEAEKILAAGGPTLLESDKPPTLQLGDTVRVRKLHKAGHTRAPGYAQGATGTVVAWHGSHIFPDRNAQGDLIGEHLYSVQFDEHELWGRQQENAEVLIDLWEPYLESIAPHA